MMKLIGFRIRNFRSIVDTGWQTLSQDNITCLIGQNESGKTSVLEGLKVFYTGNISEDVLRSDLSLPEVSCRFSIPNGWLLKVTENPGAELKELLSGLDQLELTRTWIADLSSVVKASGEISHYLDSLEDAWKLYLDDVISKLEREMKLISDMELNLSKLLSEETELKARLSETEPRGLGYILFGKKNENKPVISGYDPAELKDGLVRVKKAKDEISAELKKRHDLKNAGDKWEKLKLEYTNLDNHLADLSHKLEDRHQKMTLLLKPMYDEDETEWKTILNDYRRTRNDKDIKKEELDNQVAMAGIIMDGSTEEAAVEKAAKTVHSYKSQYNSEVLGNSYFRYCPVFEMFEDFGSLLPNRIDMEDIITGNENIEGYKAARNFLTIAKLDYSFFDQPSSRILKQKIENLNQILTKNFQDFWQQSVGRNNKINIQFELDHYNATYGNKAGKPYLEFWIKDEGERLYPKQRSRGVRWFLSFYMELKASASINRQMVLLVDEPGVSLHARAQEDVLKVFEDIRDKIQVIYTTHSPHLVEINKLHRVLAVQRDDVDNLRSTTRIIDPLRLSSASPDTLTPLQSILGNPLTGEGFSNKKYNLIVNDTGSFYFLNGIIQVMGFKGKIAVIPATGVSSIPLLCNILMGWGLDFAVVLFDNEKENKIAGTLKETLFNTDHADRNLIIELPEGFSNAEDLISTLDFKNHILKTREGITVSNSVYIIENDLPRNFLLSRFLSEIKEGKIKASDLDEETLENFKLIIDKVKVLK